MLTLEVLSHISPRRPSRKIQAGLGGAARRWAGALTLQLAQTLSLPQGWRSLYSCSAAMSCRDATQVCVSAAFLLEAFLSPGESQ